MIERRVTEESSLPVPVDPDRSFAARWKHGDLFTKGYVPVPTQFLLHYGALKPYPLTAGEAMFALQLMSFKWSAEPPFPGYATIAQRMGVTDKMVRRYAKSLEGKKYLVRRQRDGKSNSFDLTPLFDALRRHMYRQLFERPTFEKPPEEVLPF